MRICPEKSREESCRDRGLAEVGTESFTDCEGRGEFRERDAEMGKCRTVETLSLRVFEWPEMKAEVETDFLRI